MEDFKQCPACLGRRSRVSEKGPQLRECLRCECLFGTAYLGESYAIVKPQMKAANGCREVPFDIETLGSRGIGRRHGFYDPTDGLITQVG